MTPERRVPHLVIKSTVERRTIIIEIYYQTKRFRSHLYIE